MIAEEQEDPQAQLTRERDDALNKLSLLRGYVGSLADWAKACSAVARLSVDLADAGRHSAYFDASLKIQRVLDRDDVQP
jgi:hypothetical protein